MNMNQWYHSFGGRISEVERWSTPITDDEAALLASGVPPTAVRPNNRITTVSNRIVYLDGEAI